MTRLILFISLVCSTPLAYASFSDQDRLNFEENIYRSCVFAKKSNPKRGSICKCIAMNHIKQAEHNAPEGKASDQLQWVTGYYYRTLTIAQWTEDPYGIGGASGVIASFDDECNFKPSWEVIFLD